MRLYGQLYSGAEFLALCARVAAEGKYIRAVDVAGLAHYRVKAADILPRQADEGAAGSRPQPRPRRCELAVAQLWFQLCDAI